MEAAIKRISARAYMVPTDGPEADGTLAWDHTTIVVVEAEAGGCVGLGYTYAHASVADVITSLLAPLLHEGDAFDIPTHVAAMRARVRNIGAVGLCATAMSAVDIALWDLKARLLNVPLAHLFGRAHEKVLIYGSGGFTTYSQDRLREQFSGWADEGLGMAKMKIGDDPVTALTRMQIAKDALGGARLMIDANGALSRKEALYLAERAAEMGVIWFEEPVSSDDLDGLRLLRDQARAPLEVAAGEYVWDAFGFRRMMEAGAVDVMQADATRCGGYTGFLEAAALAKSQPLDISAHTAPAAHLPVCCAVTNFRHIEWFYDHTRIEHLFFDGAPKPVDGFISADLARPGHGLALKRSDVERFAA